MVDAKYDGMTAEVGSEEYKGACGAFWRQPVVPNLGRTARHALGNIGAACLVKRPGRPFAIMRGSFRLRPTGVAARESGHTHRKGL
jgi:hypothetical protein